MLSNRILCSFSILVSLSFISLFSTKFLPLQNPNKTPVFDELDDHTLLEKALKSNSLLITKNPTPKIAFLFLTNSNLTFSPLWEKFFKGHTNLYNIYVHADPTSQVSNPNGIFKYQFIPSKKTQRGSPSLVSAEKRLLARAVLDDPSNLYFALVSQHCIPLHSFRYIYTTLFGHNVFEALSSQPRHLSFIQILSKDPNLLDRYNARGENNMMPEIPFQKFKVGSQFFVLAKRHALVVLEDRKLWRKFNLPCLKLDYCYPEEHYFATLLSMKDPRGCSKFTLTNVNWTHAADGHPYVYEAEEVSPNLVHKLRYRNNHSYFFARKFAPDCLQPLMDLADDVIFKD